MKKGKRLKRLVISLCIGVVVLVALLMAAWGAGLILHDTSQAATVKEALRSFRAGGHDTGGLSGVYLYATGGSESIDALGGAKHNYPATTTITVTEVQCGLQLRWAALEGRSTAWTFCSTPAGTELRSSDERHSFFGQHDHTTYTCARRMLLPENVKLGAVYPFKCESGGGSETGDMSVLGRETIVVENAIVQALHVRSALTVHGSNSGSETIDWWLDTVNALPLRIVLQSRTARSMFIGTVHYREDLSLRLLSLTPQR